MKSNHQRRVNRIIASLCSLPVLLSSPGVAQPPDATPPAAATGAASPRPAPEVQALLEKAETFENANQNDNALHAFNEALEMARQLGDKAGQVIALRNIGVIYDDRDDHQKGLDYFQQALSLLREIGDKVKEATILRDIGVIYDNTNDYSRALTYYNNVLAVGRSIGNQRIEAQSLSDIGRLYSATGEQNKALEYYNQALTTQRTIGDRPGEARTLHAIGITLRRLGDFGKALSCYEDALALQRTLGNKDEEGAILRNIGNAYAETGDYPRALHYFQQTLSIARAIQRSYLEASALISIGSVYSDTADYPRALDTYQQALSIQTKIGDKSGEASSYFNIGSVYNGMKEYPKALAYYAKALTLRESIGDKAGVAMTLSGMGNAYNNNGDPRKALTYYQRALPIQRTIGDRLREAETLSEIGNAYIGVDEPQQALSYFQQALPMLRAVAYKAEEGRTLDGIAQAQWKLHQFRQALASSRQAVALFEQLRNQLGGYADVKTSFLSHNIGVYHRALTFHLASGDVSDAFALSEKTKARSLLDLLASGRIDISDSLTPEEKQQEDDLRRQGEQLNQQIIREGIDSQEGARKRVASYREQLRQTEQRLQTLTDALYAKHPELANKRAARTVTVAELPRFLNKDTAFLDYIQSSDKSLTLFVATLDEAGKPLLKVHTIPITADALAKICASFHDACSDPLNPYREQATELYRMLIQLAEPQLAGKSQLLLCPDGPLWDETFSALTDAQSRPLLSRFTLRLAYSATGAQAAQDIPAPTTPYNLLCLANPKFGDSKRFDHPDDPAFRPLVLASRNTDPRADPRPVPSRQRRTLMERGGIRALPGTQREANALQRTFPDAHILTGAFAQEETFKKEAGQYRYFHLATHGFFNNSSPMLSSLILAQPEPGSGEDGLLTAREIFAMKLKAELTVLSACNTGRGARLSGEGVVGLTWALLAAGCPSTIVSNWAVDDAGTAVLMGEFYRNLKAGHSKASSLRAAALKLQSDRIHSHPYYWAAFQLIGDGR